MLAPLCRTTTRRPAQISYGAAPCKKQGSVSTTWHSCIGNVVCWEVNLGKHFRIQCNLCSPPLSLSIYLPISLRSLPLAAHQRAVDCRMLVLHCVQILTSSRVFFPELLLTFTLAIDLRATYLSREKGRGCTHHAHRQDSHCAPPLLY